MKSLFIIMFAFICFGCLAQSNKQKPYLVVLSMDGFRWDYVDSFPTPNLHKIIKNGVRAKSMMPVFPSVTFPNHYSMATGLYPDHHGIVNNGFYDPVLGEYKMTNSNNAGDGRFYGGEPIWVTAEKQQINAGSYFWPGSEAEIQGMRPTYWKKYDAKVTYEQRIDTVISWLSLSEPQRPHLILFYFDYPDHLTHSVGPFGTGVRNMVMHLDTLIGVIIDKFNHLPIGKQINFIIVSDHGMEAVSNSKVVELDQYIPKSWCNNISGHNSLISFNCKQGYRDSVILGLSKAPHLKIWDKKVVPERFHYGTNPRIGELVLLADSAYSMTWTDEKLTLAGNHGYDNLNTDMHGIFFAIGPAFKKGYLQPTFENVDLYVLMAKILRILPSKNDGNIELVNGMLK